MKQKTLVRIVALAGLVVIVLGAILPGIVL